MSAPPLADQKTALRHSVRAALAQLTAAERTAAAQLIVAKLLEQPVWKSATTVLLFAPLPDEPDLWPLVHTALATGKRVALPRYEPQHARYEAAEIVHPETDLVTGRFGVREPRAGCARLPLNRLDLTLVPGVAFDRQCRRLGRGKGFYDRLLAELAGSTCGVAFDQQLVGVVPAEPHDVPLNCILTPSHWLTCPPCATGECFR